MDRFKSVVYLTILISLLFTHGSAFAGTTFCEQGFGEQKVNELNVGSPVDLEFILVIFRKYSKEIIDAMDHEGLKHDPFFSPDNWRLGLIGNTPVAYYSEGFRRREYLTDSKLIIADSIRFFKLPTPEGLKLPATTEVTFEIYADTGKVYSLPAGDYPLSDGSTLKIRWARPGEGNYQANRTFEIVF